MATATKINCCPPGIYWMRINPDGDSTDIAVRAESEQAAWRFVCQPDTWQARRYELLPTHPAPAGHAGEGSPARPNGMFQPRWLFDAGAAMSAREQYLRYVHRRREFGVPGRCIDVTRELP